MKNEKEEALANLKEMEAKTRELKDYIQSLDKQNDAKQWFKSISKELSGKIEDGCFVFSNKENLWMIKSFKDGYVWFSYERIWLIMESKFSFKNEVNKEADSFLRDVMFENFGIVVQEIRLQLS